MASTQQQKASVGRYGEELAARHLSAAGIEVLERNWRCDLGEVDLVAQEGRTLVICEVKTRRGLGFGSPLEAVTVRKLARLRRLAARRLTDYDGERTRPSTVRIDVVGVLLPSRGAAVIEHLRGVG